MLVFKEKTKILETEEAKKHVKNYNRLAQTLVEFELLWYRSWFNIIEQAMSGLHATLLVTDNSGQIHGTLTLIHSEF